LALWQRTTQYDRTRQQVAKNKLRHVYVVFLVLCNRNAVSVVPHGDHVGFGVNFHLFLFSGRRRQVGRVRETKAKGNKTADNVACTLIESMVGSLCLLSAAFTMISSKIL
jgi:hypothetical protein